MARCPSKNSQAASAVGYLRRSDEKQEASIPAQRQAVERYAREKGYTIIRWYVDDAISGDATERRHEFQRMIADAERFGDFEAVLCWDQDRFGRFDSIEAGWWIYPLRRSGVYLATVAQGKIDWNDFAGRMLYGITQEGKHQFLRDLSRNTTRGLIGIAQKGYLCGQAAPYGYDRMLVDELGKQRQRVRNGEKYVKPRSWHVTLVPSDDPEVVATLRWLFETYAETDTGLRMMADELNERGVPGPTGGPWYAASIKAILQNDKYTGMFSWARRREGKYHAVVGTEIRPRTDGGGLQLNPQETWITKPRAHEALISQDMFDRVQKKLHARRRDRAPGEGYSYRTHTRRNGDAYLLTGLVYCDHCGCKMHGSMSTRRKNGKTYRYAKYICSTYCRCGRGNPSGCGYHTVEQSKILAVLVRKLREAVLKGDTKERLRQAVLRHLAARSKPTARQEQQLRRRLRELEREIDRAAERLLKAPDDLMDVLAPKLQAMKKERERLTAQLATTGAIGRQKGDGDTERQADAVVDRLWSLGEELECAEPARLRELFQRMVRRVDLRFNHVQRGKRVECPVATGTIHLRTDSDLFGSVNRGDWI